MRPKGEASAVLRNGRGLLHGLIRCGICGRRMRASYPAVGDAVRYDCSKKGAVVSGQGVCQSLGGMRIEKEVVDAFLETVGPASMEIAVAALDKLENGKDAVLQQLEDQHADARYQAARARRQYDAVEPENRKVARTLETAWNERLARAAELEERIERHRSQRPAPLTAAEKERLLRLGVDARAIWSAATTTSRDKKQLLRAVFEAVFVRVDRKTREAHVTLVWQGGATTELTVQMPRVGEHSVIDDKEVIEEIRRMATRVTDKQIARALNGRGLRTASGLPFTVDRVTSLRQRHGIEVCHCERADAGEPIYTAQDAARELGVSLITILRWLKEGFLAGEQVAPYAPWEVRLPDCVRLRTAPQAPDGWLPIRQAASFLGVTSRDVLHSIQRGELEAMMGGIGRRRGLRVNVAGKRSAAQRSLFKEPTD